MNLPLSLTLTSRVKPVSALWMMATSPGLPEPWTADTADCAAAKPVKPMARAKAAESRVLRLFMVHPRIVVEGGEDARAGFRPDCAEGHAPGEPNLRT